MSRTEVLLAVFGMLLLGSSGGAPAQSAGVSSVYRIGPRDRIEIEVFELPELSVQRRVSEEGMVRLPVLGDVEAAGKTAGELADHLEQTLEASYVERASVRVEVLEVLSRSLKVLGAVRSPGELGLPADWTLLDALTAAGGLADGHGAFIHVLRRADNGLSDQISIPVEELTLRANTRYNLPVFPDDIIHVERREKVRIYVLGEVANPGVLEFDSTERATLLFALARAGGLGDRASPRITVRRQQGAGESDQLTARYKRIISGKEPDLELEDGDVIIVKESFF